MKVERDFQTGLAQTVDWHRDHRGWWEPLPRAGLA